MGPLGQGGDDRRAGRLALAVLGLSTLFKIAVAWSFPLGVDEAYAIAVAREFSISFFDHPPLGFWAPVASAALFGEHALAYRLPDLACGLGTGLLLWTIATRLGGARAGLWTVVLWSLAPHMVLGSGAFVLPDAPLNLGGALAALALARMAPQQRPPLTDWALLGLGAAIGMASKYQAGLIPLAAMSFALTSGRAGWLRQPGFALAAGLGALGVAPVILWNLQTDWASFAFHGGRTARALQPANFAAMLAGQLVYLLPVTFVLALAAVWRGLRSAPPERVLAHLALWPILLFNAIFLLSDASFPHWTMPGFVFALPLCGLWLARSTGRGWRWALAGFAVPVWALIAVLLVHVPTGVLTRGGPVPDWDRTEEVFDWSGLAPALEQAGALEGIQALAAESWITAGQMSTGMAIGLGHALPMRVLGPAKHHFAFHQGARSGMRALYLVPDRANRLDLQGALDAARRIDPQAQLVDQVMLPRGAQESYAGAIAIALTLP